MMGTTTFLGIRYQLSTSMNAGQVKQLARTLNKKYPNYYFLVSHTVTGNHSLWVQGRKQPELKPRFYKQLCNYAKRGLL